jgi:hypothetical protein
MTSAPNTTGTVAPKAPVSPSAPSLTGRRWSRATVRPRLVSFSWAAVVAAGSHR